MSKDDWFRRTEWNPSIERAFFDKLKRARDKAQYLRIQASYLASSHPTIALELLSKYFRCGDDWDDAAAFVDEARAHLALGRLDAAAQAYERAIAREIEFPNLQTDANLEFPLLIATHALDHLYDRAQYLLAAARSGLTFPVDHFRWYAAQALIDSALEKNVDAMVNACEALRWSDKDRSDFRYHPKVGLVSNKYDVLRTTLKSLCNEGKIS